MNDLILAVTDGTSASTKAFHYAAHLAKRMNADVLIAPLSQLVMKSLAVNSAEDMIIADDASQLPPLKYIVIAGDVYFGASSLIAGPAYEQLLLKSNAPVIIIPEDAPMRYTEKFVFLTDISANDHCEIDQLCRLADLSAGSVMLTQVNAPGQLDREQQTVWDQIMREKISTIAYGRIYHQNIPENSGTTDMDYVIHGFGAETIALAYPQDNILGKELLSFGLWGSLLGSLKIPLILFPKN